MALKDWKRVKDVSGGNKRIAWIKNGEQVIIFYPIDKSNKMFPIKGYNSINIDEPKIFTVRTPIEFMVDFKTKTQALKYAKSYMRSH